MKQKHYELTCNITYVKKVKIAVWAKNQCEAEDLANDAFENGNYETISEIELDNEGWEGSEPESDPFDEKYQTIKDNEDA